MIELTDEQLATVGVALRAAGVDAVLRATTAAQHGATVTREYWTDLVDELTRLHDSIVEQTGRPFPDRHIPGRMDRPAAGR